MNTNSSNPRERMGANLSNDAPDYAKLESERLQLDYAELGRNVDALDAEAKAITEVSTPEAKEVVVGLIKRLRDASKRVLGFHELEKMPHYRRGQGVDQYFFGLADRLAKRGSGGRPGEADRLNGLLTAYDSRVLAQKREQERLAAEAAAKVAREAEEKRLREEAEARRLADEAARARKPEKIAEKTAAAEEAATRASQARVEEQVAVGKAEDARIDTLRTPAEQMRTRTADGTLSTMGEEKFAVIEDRQELDLNKLRPYIPQAALETALRAYANSVQYSNDASVQIKGARFGKRPRSIVR